MWRQVLQLVRGVANRMAPAAAQPQPSMNDLADSRSGGAARGSSPILLRRARTHACNCGRPAFRYLLASLCAVVISLSTPIVAAARRRGSPPADAAIAAHRAPTRPDTGGVDAALILHDVGLPLSSRSQGPRRARVRIVEWADYECPYCKAFSSSIEQELAASPADIEWTYRFFPLPGHGKPAMTEAVAGACIARVMGPASFWRYTKEIFLTTRGDGQGPGVPMTALMSRIHVATPRVDACIRNGKGAAMVQADRKLGLRVGVLLTPTSFLIGSRTGRIVKIEGALNRVRLDKIVRKLLSERDPH